MILRGDQVADGRFDAWIERDDRSQMRFSSGTATERRTISIPGTARHAVTVGSYVTRTNAGSPHVGFISSFSSRGPDRLGGNKPDLAAPGEWITSTRSSTSGLTPDPDFFHATIRGTSMAAPHVTGIAALMLQRRPRLTGDQVQQILRASARRDGQASSAPDEIWGHGRLDAMAAVTLAETAEFRSISQVDIASPIITIELDAPGTCALRLHRHQLRLLMGESEASRASLSSRIDHSFDLTGLASGRWFFEVAAFSSENLRTLDDNGRLTFEVVL